MDTENKKKIYPISEVSSIVSHQFKTPLAGIKSSLEVLVSGDLGEIGKDQKYYLERALENTGRLINLVKNMLSISKIDAEMLELHPTEVNLVDVVKEVISELSSIALANNAEIKFDEKAQIRAISIDRVKIKEVFNNLIYNAIRYKNGKASILVSLVDEGSEIIFSCKDNGIGIDEDEKDKIFGKFYRSSRVMEIWTEGTGLGLFIAKAIVEKSGGRIWFESAHGVGTTFYVSLPVK